MSTPIEESQKLLTQATLQLLEFDFTTVGGTAHVYLSTEHEEDSTGYIPVSQGGNTYTRIDFEMSGMSSDLTGSVAEPKLEIAAHDLWQIAGWASATTGFSLMDYRGLRVKRQRKFFNTLTPVAPQVYYVKSVDELSATKISFTLTPSLGSERLDRPSARKLEI